LHADEEDEEEGSIVGSSDFDFMSASSVGEEGDGDGVSGDDDGGGHAPHVHGESMVAFDAASAECALAQCGA
jgi:hypothetical protein